MMVNYDSAAGYHQTFTDNISFSNANHVNAPGQSYTTDGEGIIIDSMDYSSPAYTGSILVAGNVLFGNGGRGFACFASSNVDFINNTTYGNFIDTEQQNYPSGGADISVVQCGNVNVKNNIAQSATSSNVSLLQNTSTSVNWSNNVAYVGGTQSDGSAISGSANKLSTNPLFKNASTNTAVADFGLQSGSPAIGYASANSFTYTSLAGTVVSSGTTHNAGAY